MSAAMRIRAFPLSNFCFGLLKTWVFASCAENLKHLTVT